MRAYCVCFDAYQSAHVSQPGLEAAGAFSEASFSSMLALPFTEYQTYAKDIQCCTNARDIQMHLFENCDVLHKIDTDAPSPKFNLTHETPASYRRCLFSGATPSEEDWQPKARVVLMVVAGSVVFDQRREEGCGSRAEFIANFAKPLLARNRHVRPITPDISTAEERSRYY